MNRPGQIAVIAVLVLLIVMFGVGMFFSGPVSVPVSSSTSASATPASGNPVSSVPAATQIVQYIAAVPASSTPVRQGSCWTNSIAAPFRGDAWRCTVGNDISDPCFQIPGEQKLLCNVNPTEPDTTSTFVLQLTKALPASEPVQGMQPSGSGWLVELQGGTLCTPFTGTLPFTDNGETATYACAPGALGNDLVIFGINSSSSIWTAEVGTLGAAPANSSSDLPVVKSSSTVPITEVWQ